MKSVSYTHLDVYKRQSVRCVKFLGREIIAVNEIGSPRGTWKIHSYQYSTGNGSTEMASNGTVQDYNKLANLPL